MKRKTITRSRAALGVGIVVIAAAAIFKLSGCGRPPMAAADNGSAAAENGSAPSGDGPRVETVRVERRDLVNTVEMPGTVEGFESVSLKAKVGGYLKHGFTIHPKTGNPIDIGDRVYKDQVLARLWIPEMDSELKQNQAALAQAEAEVAQAEAAVVQAQAELESAEAMLDEKATERAEKQADLRFAQAERQRYEQLVASQAARRELLDRAKSQHEAALAAMQSVEARIRTARAKRNAAEAAVAKARADTRAAKARHDVAKADVDYVRTMMEYAEITAPFEGIVTERHVHSGAFIQPAEGNSAAKPLLTIKRIQPVRVSLVVPMNKVRYLNVGDRAVLRRVSVLPGETFEGTVTRFAAALNESSRLMRVEIDLPNEDGRLRPGYYGYMTVYLEELKDTPAVPSSALLTDDRQKYVYVCSGGRAHKRPVKTNYQDGTWVGIAEGLEGGEQVVRAGGGQITDGQSVTPVLAKAPTSAAN